METKIETKSLPEFLYRYEDYHDAHYDSIDFKIYKVLSETKCGYWIDANYPYRLQTPWVVNYEKSDKKFVLKGNDGKRFAYTSKEAALQGFIYRKARQTKLAAARFTRANSTLIEAKDLLEELKQNGKDKSDWYSYNTNSMKTYFD